MRKLFCMLLMGLLAGVGAAAEGTKGAAADADFQISGMNVVLCSTPQLNYQNYSSGSRSGNRSRWARLEVSFQPKSGRTASGWYDDVSMEGTLVVLSTQKGGKSAGAPLYVVLTGRTRFLSIDGDGKTHMGMLFAPPRLLDRYYTAGKAFSEAMFVAARVNFYGAGRTLLGRGYWYENAMAKAGSAAARKAEAFLAKFDRTYPDVVQIPGGLYSKEKTPWEHFNYDQYDLIAEDGGAPAVK